VSSTVYADLETSFRETPKWNSLDRAFVNFTHFVPITEGPDGDSFKQQGLFMHWMRHSAFTFSRQNFPRIDLLIPMAFSDTTDENGKMTESSMSFIIISVKNTNGTDSILQPFLTKEMVEGKQTDTGGANMKDGKHKRKTMTETIKGNMYLKLNELTFISKSTDPDDWSSFRWVESTARQPFIAFIMSMGDTNRSNDLFISEKPVRPFESEG